MGILERKIRERESRRQCILSSARKVFLEKGLDAGSLAEIAEEAELSKAALYLYFRDKAGILAEILAQSLGVLGNLYKTEVPSSALGLDRLKAWGRAFTKFSMGHPQDFYFFQLIDLVDLPLEKIRGDTSPAAVLIDQFRRDIFECFELGIKDGSLRSDLDPGKTPLVLSQIFTSYIQSLSLRGDQVKINTGYSNEELISHLFDILLHAIESPRVLQGDHL